MLHVSNIIYTVQVSSNFYYFFFYNKVQCQIKNNYHIKEYGKWQSKNNVEKAIVSYELYVTFKKLNKQK